jgi:hypothetical protein
MASADGVGVPPPALASVTPTPICELEPNITNPSSRVVRGEIRVTKPHSRVTRTLEYILVETDRRLRREKGQVRFKLRGPVADEVAEWGLRASDTVLFSLDGVHWAKDDAPGRIPGQRLEWQMEFVEKLTLMVGAGALLLLAVAFR